MGASSSLPVDPDLAFKLKTRRDRLFGLWAANRLGLNGREAEAYARRITTADMRLDAEIEVLHQVAADLCRYSSFVDEDMLRRELKRFEDIARDQLNRESRRTVR